MASSRPYLDLTLGEWLDELAQSDHVPGGGSALGAAVAMAAAVLAMTARVSGAGGLVAQADALCARTRSLAQRDADAYSAALGARVRVAELKPELRDWEIGRAFADAAEAPLEIARAGADVAALAAELAASGDPHVHADALAAAALGAAAARGAAELVAVNLTAVNGDPRVAEARRLAEDADRAAARVD
ncbi:MAG TPA: cyclodeaminase/cyclohydrolase family protein [Gaiellaceae bacterium]